MPRRATTTLAGFVLLAATALSVPAGAEGSTEAVIWYRSADGCPDGDTFLHQLDARGVRGRLARVGDAVDFVVTLGKEQESAQGLLERQTATGTVAVRRLEAGNCEEVSDGIALILAMANDSAKTRSANTPPRSQQDDPPVLPSSAAPPARDAAVPRVKDPASRWAVGARGGVLSGVTPGALAEAALFVQFEPWASRGGAIGGAALRGYAFGGVSSRDELSTWIVAGRLEACPVALGSRTLSVSPCIGFDLGTIHAGTSGANAAKDQGIWAAAEAGARFSVGVTERISVEAQLAAVAPFRRYDFASERSSTPLYAASSVGLSAAVGLEFRLP